MLTVVCHRCADAWLRAPECERYEACISDCNAALTADVTCIQAYSLKGDALYVLTICVCVRARPATQCRLGGGGAIEISLAG